MKMKSYAEISDPLTMNYDQNSESMNGPPTPAANNGSGNKFRCYSQHSTVGRNCYDCPDGWSFNNNDRKCYKCNGQFQIGSSYTKCLGCIDGYALNTSNYKCYKKSCEGNKVYDSNAKKCYDCSNVKIDGVDTTYIDKYCWKKCNVNENEDPNNKRYCKTQNCPPNHIYDKTSSMCKIPLCNNGIYDPISGKCKSCKTGGTIDRTLNKCIHYPEA